ncbi:hypothetical protein [Vulcanisaeta sp. JCM 16161]|uniref:hypothetical protein n=1 Tax=Vulcanisaeta sp. JCM 16161 TaxID=1295372 RepID=UPI001FB24A0E|nr:hypothetical protein [Vulcanisaeta sp. JCM 16161]
MGWAFPIIGLTDWWLGADDCWYDKPMGLGMVIVMAFGVALAVTGLIMLTITRK